MKLLILHTAIMLLFLLPGKMAKAQADPLKSCLLTGKVTDSVTAEALPAATIAVYMVKDTSLIGYTLSDKSGQFTIKNLPCAVPLRMIISFAGYKGMVKLLQMPAEAKTWDAGNLAMLPAGELDAVVVTGLPPPVRMNGDTIEFNADAFKLDPNAQAEDLLRVLPGVTIWADGVITVNGREVRSVLVNGKPFFGGDPRVATQNIPKNIIDKVQVYQKDIGGIDSATEVNIKLKKGKDAGIFGKLGAGYGTRNYRELDGSINLFNRKTQVTAAGAHNNINKMVDNVGYLLTNHTFKGTGARVEYQSDFRMPGINRFSGGGMLVQHDFWEDPGHQHTNRLTGNYFLNHTTRNHLSSMQILTQLNDSSFFGQDRLTENNSTSIRHSGSVQYELQKNSGQLSVHGNYSRASADNNSVDRTNMLNTDQELVSTNSTLSNSNSTSDHFQFHTRYVHGYDSEKGDRLFSNYEVSYSLNHSVSNTIRNLHSLYEAINQPDENRELTRQYDNHISRQVHRVRMSFPALVSDIFGKNSFGGMKIGLANDLDITANKEDNVISDTDTTLHLLKINPYLTNLRDDIAYDIRPQLRLLKKFRLKLTPGRFSELATDINAGPQFYSLISHSQKQFQQFSKNFTKLRGNAGISFQQSRRGMYLKMVRLEFSLAAEFPGLEKLAPLTDSANLNFIIAGNKALRAQESRTISLNYMHTSLRSHNTFNYSFGVMVGDAKDYFAFNNTVDSLGRTVSSYVNANGYRQARVNAELRKNYTIKNSQLQFYISPSVYLSRVPIMLNKIADYYNNLSISFNPGLTYQYKDLLELQVSNSHSYGRFKQENSSNLSVGNSANEWQGAFQLRVTKKLAVGSNIIHTSSTFNGERQDPFTIWNAGVVLRLLKANNMEIKFSALDMLKQNTGLFSFASVNSVTRETTNVLQQYFMLSLSWYPRKFGK